MKGHHYPVQQGNQSVDEVGMWGKCKKIEYLEFCPFSHLYAPVTAEKRHSCRLADFEKLQKYPLRDYILAFSIGGI